MNNRPILLLAALLVLACSGPVSKNADPAVEYQMPAPSCTWMTTSCARLDGIRDTAPTNEINLVMAKGEWEHFQLLIAVEGAENYSVSRIGNETVLDMKCRTIATFDGMEDILVPCDGNVHQNNGEAKLWISFRSHKDAKPGTYVEVLEFRHDTVCVPLKATIKIEDVLVPEVPSIPAVFGINPDMIVFDANDAETKAAARKEVSDLLLEYRISPYFCEWISGTMKLETNSTPYGPSDERMWNYLKDPRFTAIALPSFRLSDDELSAMFDRARREGILEKAYFYIWDEPTTQYQYSQIRQMAERIHKYAPEARVLTTFYCGPTDGPNAGDLFATFEELRGATSIFCTGVWSLQTNEERSAQAAASCKDPEEWWTYVCMGDNPGLAWNVTGIANRAIMWRSWKEGPKGFLFWSVNGFQSVNPLKVRPELPQGDAVLVLPGQEFGYDGLCVSARLERWRDGAEDYELLMQYEKALGRDAALALLGSVYKDPIEYTDNAGDVATFHKHLIQDVL